MAGQLDLAGRAPADRRLAVVINALAGNRLSASPAGRQALSRLFQEAGLAAPILWTTSADLPAVLEGLKSSAIEVLVVGGGDGTLHTAANRLTGTAIALGILPLGTLNHFAQDLGIPLALEDAVRVLAHGVLQTVDVGEVNGEVFINNATLGIYPYALRQRERYRQQLGLSRWVAMGYALVGALWRLPVFRGRLSVNGLEERVESHFLLIGNNRYLIEPPGTIKRQSLNQGELCIAYIRRLGRLVLLKFAFQVLFARVQPGADLTVLMAREAFIESRSRRKRLKLAMDGEVIAMPLPLRVRIRPGALRVLVPPPG